MKMEYCLLTDKFERPADQAVDDNGKPIEGAYREATITLFQKEYEVRGATGSALDAQLVAVFGHEARHDLDPRQVEAGVSGTGSNAIWHPKAFDKRLQMNVDAKRSPDWYQEKILKEVEKTKGINAGRY